MFDQPESSVGDTRQAKKMCKAVGSKGRKQRADASGGAGAVALSTSSTSLP